MRNKLCARIFVMVLLAGFFMTLPVRGKKAKEADYFPLKVGYWWKYRIKKMNAELVIKIVGREKVGKYNCFVINMINNGKLDAIAYYARTNDRILLVGAKDPQSKRVFILKKPEIYLSLPLKVGKTWKTRDETGDGKSITKTKRVIMKEKVEVPAGSFSTFYVDIRPAGKHSSNEFWYAPGVGVVKMSIGTGETRMMAPLVEYKVK